MSRYIDADLLLSKMDGRYRQIINVVDDSLAEGFLAVDRLIKEQPTADVKEVVHGKWEIKKRSKFNYDKCSVCGFEKPSFLEFKKYDFCPNCGADMREGVER